ncbi:MAG: hypothetical protein ACXWWO_06050 [Candidatus Limnocylindria bacterium]
MNWFPVLLVVHIGLAVSMLLPSVVLPFVLRRAGFQTSALTRTLMAMQGGGTLLIGAGLAVTGAAMLWILGPQLLAQPWLLAALALYALNLAVAALVSRPNLRRLVGIGSTALGSAGEDAWSRLARRQRLVAYGMAGAIGVIGFLMSTKPRLW